MESLKSFAILIPLLPLLGTLLVGVVGLRFLRDKSHWLVIAGVGVSLVLACFVWRDVATQAGRDETAHGMNAETAVGTSALSKSIPIYNWFLVEANPAHGSSHAGGWLPVSFRVDQLTCVMLLTVLTVSFMVIIYSRGYMRDHHGHPERGYERFFAFLGLFVFSMCALVLAGNFLVLYLGWELVGLSSYLLIGFYYQKPEAALAARKAFLVNRIGDFGFALGIWLIYLTFNTLDYHTVFSLVSGVAQFDAGHNHQAFETLVHSTLGAHVNAFDFKMLVEGRITWIALLLFCGAIGKSAQFPLHVWLPDAMEGPTPVSALIHAATMVTAGVYLVARCAVIFASSEIAMWLVAAIGTFTAFFAATIALTQFDMKRILAYSTLSQLGYMFMGLGVGAFDSAVFHLYTHAFFKACLFLGAGSVMHAMGGVIDIRKFGGLRRQMPFTYWTFLISSLALAGCPLLAAFWSKDEIIHAAMNSNMPIFGVIGLITALLTAIYTFRMVAMAFWGPLRLPQGIDHAHEGGIWMNGPLVFLAIGAVFAGYVGVSFAGGGFLGIFEPHGVFHHFLEPIVGNAKAILAGPQMPHAMAAAAEHGGGHMMMYISAIIAIVGVVGSGYVYVKRPTIPWAIAAASGSMYRLLYHKYYVDEIYDRVFVQPLRRIGRLCFSTDRNVINAVLYVLGNIPRAIGFCLRGGQQGAMQGYALGMILGIVALIWIVLNGIS